MPVHERSYRRLASPFSRRIAPAFLAIASFGYRQRRGKLFWLFVLIGWAPAIVCALAIYSSEEGKTLTLPGFRGVDYDELAQLPGEQWRHYASVGAILFIQFETVAITLMTALTGAPAIAEDLRRHALELYFAKPISGVTYVLGKWLVVFRCVLMAVLWPLLFTCLMAWSFLPGFSDHCLSVVVRSALGVMFLAAAHAIVVLGISSCGRSSRYATVMWFILVFFSWAISLVLIRLTGDTTLEVVSYRHNVEAFVAAIVDTELPTARLVRRFVATAERSLFASGAVLGGCVLGAVLLIGRRIKALARG